MKKQLAIVLPFLAFGCGGPEDLNGDGIVDGVREPNTVSVVAPASPKGTVSGQVLNTSMAPLVGASVSMTIGSATTEAPVKTETDADGNFMFKNVPAGSQVLLTINRQGYATVRATTTVPVSAGNIPLNNGNASLGVVSLAELNGTVRFTLVTPAGRPAAGASAFIEVTPTAAFSTNGTSIVGNLVSTVRLSAQADAQGVVTFSGVPKPSEMARLPTGTGFYHLWVEPVDLNNDGVLEAGGLVTSYTAQTLLQSGTTQLVALPYPQNSGNNTFATLEAANLASLVSGSKEPLRNMLRTGEPIYVAFSHPVQQGSLLATVTDEFGREGFNLTATANATGDVYNLALPALLVIREGQEYNLILRATSAYDGSSFIRKGYFVSGDARSPRSTALPAFVTAAFRDGSPSTPANGQLDSGECVVVTFNQVIVPPEGTGAAAAHAFFNAELGFNAGIGNDAGEYNHGTGFMLRNGSPPQKQAGCFDEETVYPIDTATFTYTPRYYFWFAPPNSSVSIPVGTKVRLGFGHHQSTTASVPYRTAWGVSLTENLEVDLTRLP